MSVFGVRCSVFGGASPLGVVLAVGVAGCTSLSPAYVQPAVETPEVWKNAGQEAGSTAVGGFGSVELEGLEQRALARNTDVRAAVARVEQARAQLKVAGATMVPSVDVTGNVGRTLTSARGDTSGRSSSGVGVGLAYELDIFGRNAAAREGARASLKGSGFDKQALDLTTVRDVRTTYFQLMGLRERVGLAVESLQNAEQVLNLLRVRQEVGTASALEVSQQEASVEGSRASLASLRASEKAALSALAVLVGEGPSAFEVSGTSLSEMVAPQVGVGVPSALLAKRPDILAAEATLQAANADIGAARSALFPQVNLSAGQAFAFDPASSTVNLAAGLTAPIFHGGALRGQLEVTKARQRELVEGYRGTVLNAFREVEDALANAQAAEHRYAALLKASMAANRAYEITRIQLQAGAVDMPTLLESQRTQLSANDSLIQARQERLAAAAALEAAVGRSD